MTISVLCMQYRFDSFILDLEQGALLTADGKEMPLRAKSFKLLQFLVENAGRLLSQEAIMEALWPNVFVTENNVTQCIHDIRSALGPKASQIIRTRPRRGYLFASDVSTMPSKNPLRQIFTVDQRGEIAGSQPVASGPDHRQAAAPPSALLVA